MEHTPDTLELGHRRHTSAGSRRSSISSISDDGRSTGGRGRGLGSWSRASSQHHILSPPLPEHDRPVSAASFQKGSTLADTSEYGRPSTSTRHSIADLSHRVARKSRSIANLSLLQGFQRPKWLTWFRQKYWAYEVLALLGALILILILFALLGCFAGKDYQSWQFKITLNAMVSLLVALMGPILVMPVQSCLGQLKWNRFRRHGGDLREFDLHDQASRTAWGAAKLIIKKPKQPHGLFAAVITIAIVSIAPLVQQIISIGPWPYDSTPATVQVSYSYIEKDDPALPLDQLTQFSVYQALYTMYPGGFGVYPTVDATENATFGRYATLGLSSECVDITDKLTKNEIQTQNVSTDFFKVKKFELALPNGHQFNGTPNAGPDVAPDALQMDSFSISSDYDSINFKDRGNVLVDWTAMYVPPMKRDSPEDVKPIVWECMIQFAGWPVTSYSRAGQANPGPFIEYLWDKPVHDNSEEAQKASPFLTHLKEIRSKQVPIPKKSRRDDALTCTNMTVPTEPGQFKDVSTCYRTTSKLARYLAATFNGRVTTYATPDKILTNSSSNVAREAQVAKADVLVSIASVIGGPPKTAAPGFNIGGMMNATVSSLTNNIRTASLDSDKQLHSGWANKERLIYFINWNWIAVPILLMLMTTALLIWTIIDTKRKNLPVWGTSCLADLVHGLDETTRNTMMSIDEVEQLERTSERISVFLRPSDRVLAAVDSEMLSGTAIGFEAPKESPAISRSLFKSAHPYQQI